MTTSDAVPTPRIGLLGAGAIADFHATALTDLGVPVCMVADPDADEVAAFARRHGIEEAATDPRAVIGNDDVDAVIVASPSPIHAEQAMAALEAGRHVLAEIPLALSLGQAEDAVSLAASVDRTLAVCHTLRYFAPFDAVREKIASGAVRPRNIVARGLSLRRENVGWTGRRRDWTDDLLWHHGGHVVDAVLGFLGAPVEAVDAAVGPVWEGSGRAMDYAISLRTEDGGVASIALSYNARLGASDYLLIGEGDSILIEGSTVRSADGLIYEGPDSQKLLQSAIRDQDGSFVEAVRTGGRTASDAASLLPTFRVLQAVHDRVG